MGLAGVSGSAFSRSVPVHAATLRISTSGFGGVGSTSCRGCESENRRLHFEEKEREKNGTLLSKKLKRMKKVRRDAMTAWEEVSDSGL